MLKGMLEGCVLAIISQKKTYGYEISDQLMAYGFGKIENNTIYPLLNRLEKKETNHCHLPSLRSRAQTKILCTDAQRGAGPGQFSQQLLWAYWRCPITSSTIEWGTAWLTEPVFSASKRPARGQFALLPVLLINHCQGRDTPHINDLLLKWQGTFQITLYVPT